MINGDSHRLLINGDNKRGQSPFISLFCVVIFLRTHLAEHFLFQIGDATLELDVLHAAQMGFYGIDLRMKRDDLLFGRHAGHVASDAGDVGFDAADIFCHGGKTFFDNVGERINLFPEGCFFRHGDIVDQVLILATSWRNGERNGNPPPLLRR